MKVLDNSSIPRYNLFFLFVIIIYSASASDFVRSFIDPTSVSFYLLIILTGIFILKNKVSFDNKFYLSVFVFLVYSVITTILNHHFSPGWTAKWLLTLLISCSVCRTFGEKLFVSYETIMSFLCLVAFAFWVIHIVAPNLLVQFVTATRFSSSYADDFDTINNIFYTINDDQHLNIDTRIVTRNAGICWEPGAYSVFVCFAIFSNILRTNFRLKNNRPLIIFILSLLSTQSTTGYSIFFCMLFLWLIFNKRLKWTLVIIPLIISVMSLDFMQSKIIDQEIKATDFSLSSLSSDRTTNVNRFISIVIYWNEFRLHPFVGLGGDEDLSMVRRAGYQVSLASGIGQMLALYGIILTICYFLCVMKTIKIINSEYGKDSFLLIIPFSGLLISYLIWSLPLFISFAFYGFYNYHPVSCNKT